MNRYTHPFEQSHSHLSLFLLIKAVIFICRSVLYLYISEVAVQVCCFLIFHVLQSSYHVNSQEMLLERICGAYALITLIVSFLVQAIMRQSYSQLVLPLITLSLSPGSTIIPTIPTITLCSSYLPESDLRIKTRESKLNDWTGVWNSPWSKSCFTLLES